jgi:hypothetical protein
VLHLREEADSAVGPVQTVCREEPQTGAAGLPERRNEMKREKRICAKCKEPIRKHHRWHVVRRRFWFLIWERYHHHNCDQPEMGPARPRDPREALLSFPVSDGQAS